MPVSGRAWDALKVVGDREGAASRQYVGKVLGVGTEYAGVILADLGKNDYIDYSLAGKAAITYRGWEELARKGWIPPSHRQAARNKATEVGPKCLRCGTSNQPGARFCSSCNQYLIAVQEWSGMQG